MSDKKPSRSRAWLTLIAPLTITAVIATMVAVSIATRRPARAPGVAVSPAPIAAASPTPAPPTAVAGRADIIDAANSAAVAYAAGLAPSAAKAGLIGRTFKVRIPFGCEGPQVGPGLTQAHYELDPDGKTDTLVAQPTEWSSLPVLQATSDIAKAESVEGFWIPRPWTYLDTCPPQIDRPLPANPTPPSGQTLGLAQIFGKGADRTLNHTKVPYRTVWRPKASGAATTPSPGFGLVLEGRVVGFADGRAIRCWSESSDHRPVCIVAVVFSRVAFEDGDGKPIAEWRQ